MKERRKKMNVFIVTLFWVLGVALAITLLLFVVSGFDALAFVYVGFFFVLLIPGVLWIMYSFLLGYTGGRGWLTALPIMAFILAIYSMAALDSYSGKATFFGDLFVIGMVCLLFVGAGLLCRYGLHRGIFAQLVTYLFAGVAGLLGFYLVLAFVTRNNSLSLMNESYFWRPPYADVQKNGTVLIRDKKLHLNPFPSRVIGVFSYNNREEYCGWSISDGEEHKIVNNSRYVRDTVSPAVLVHKNYLSTVRAFMADCKDALYVKNDQYAVFLYFNNDTLCRKELDYYENGIIRQMRSYVYQGINGFRIDKGKTKEFDALGYTPKHSLFHDWHYRDFVAVDTPLTIEAAYGKVYTPGSGEYFPRQQEIIEKYLRITKHEPDTTQQATPPALDMPLDEYYQLGGINGKSVSVHIDTRAYKWIRPKPSSFEALKEIPSMETIISALDLCRLEPGMWERIGEQSSYVGSDDECYRIMIKENRSASDDSAKEEKDTSTPPVNKINAVVFYLFDGYAVTADSRFLFRFDPTIHPDPELQEKARDSWEQMMKIFKEHAEESN